MIGLGERRRSWHESEHSLDRVTEYLPRSRSYEHIDEPFSGEGAGEPHTVDDPEDPRLSSDSANQKPSQKSRKTRKKASSSSKLAKEAENKNAEAESESRLLDIRNHHVPKKLSSLSESAPQSSTASTSSSSAIRKGSMANIFKGITIPGRDRKGRNSRAEKSSSSPRHKSSSNMPIIHSDTDTDNDQRRMRSSDRNNGVRRNESNSSASISRNNSLKGEKIKGDSDKGDRHLDSGSEFDESDFEEDAELNAADIPDTWYAFTDQKNNPNVKEKAEMKRQENIYELIYTERNHHRVLKIMQKIFIGQMRKELGFTREKAAKFFPDLDELALISKEFLIRLTKRQEESLASETPVIEKISDILLNFWNSDWGERKAIAYGRLCARQHDSLKLYKEEIKNNKRFNSFIQKYKGKSHSRILVFLSDL